MATTTRPPTTAVPIASSAAEAATATTTQPMATMSASRRDKFKCMLFCFRTYVEDAAFVIAILGIAFSILAFLFVYRVDQQQKIYVSNSSTTTINISNSGVHWPALYFLQFTFPSILLHAGIIAALITRVPAFCYPYLIAQFVVILYIVAYFLLSDVYIMLQGILLPTEEYFYSVNMARRFLALNRFVVLGLVLVLQLWVCSIVWRTMCALNWERVGRKLARENGGVGSNKPHYPHQQHQKAHTPPILFKLEAPAKSCFWTQQQQQHLHQSQPQLNYPPHPHQQYPQLQHHHPQQQQQVPTAPFAAAVVDA